MSCGCGGSGHGFVIAPCTTRVDVTANAGEDFDLLVPVLQCNGDPLDIAPGTEQDWSAEAMVRRNAIACNALHTWSTSGDSPNAFVVPGEQAYVRLTATAAETSAWQQTWPDYTCSWDIELTEPQINGGDPYRLAAGLFNLSAQHTRI
jgi:hypothetical protein